MLRSCGGDAAVLTSIGIATAFGLLVVLMVVIVAVRVVSTRLLSSPDGGAASRNRAIAAVAAVTALLAQPGPLPKGPEQGAGASSDGGE